MIASRQTRTLATALLAQLAIAGSANSNETESCAYVQSTPRGAISVCEMPLTNEQCIALAQLQNATNPQSLAGLCANQDVVGTCDKGATKIIYYEGNREELIIGCGFQGGTWLNGFTSQ